jgi:hypothetical protein
MHARLGSFWRPLNPNAADRLVRSDYVQRRPQSLTQPRRLRHRALGGRRAIGADDYRLIHRISSGSARSLTDHLGQSWSAAIATPTVSNSELTAGIHGEWRSHGYSA